MVGSLVAGWLLEVHWRGMAGWRWIFITEGIAPIAVGIAALFYLTDRPQQARWLSADERGWLSAELEAEVLKKKKARDYTIVQAFLDKRVVLLW